MTTLAGLWESVAMAPPQRPLFLSGDQPVTAGEIVATADLNKDLIGDTQGPVFLHTDSAAMFLVGMLTCAQLGRELVCPAHVGSTYLDEIGVGAGVVLTDTAVDHSKALQMRPLDRLGTSTAMPKPPTRPLRITFFTSGSSGTPKAVERTLEQMETEVRVLESLWGGAPGPVLGTVTHQHIYGLGFRIVWPVMAGRPSADRRTDFWEQLQDRLAPGTMFISSPAHLTRLPGPGFLDRCRPQMIFSAGALLPLEAAQACDRLFGTVPIEILGSTETSAVAWRQQRTGDTLWTPLHGVAVAVDQAGCLTVESPFVEPGLRITMGDRIEMAEPGTFRLLGRADRVVKVEGVRVSLTRVEEALADLEEVGETAVAVLLHRRGRIGAAVVLSPTGTSALAEQGPFRLSRRLRAALAGRLDSIERPKFWRFVRTLPMNSQGKRVDADVRALFDTSSNPEHATPGVRRMDDHEAEIDVRLDGDMPWFGGHFPGQPVFPGVAEVHLAVSWSQRVWNWCPSSGVLTRVKFHQVLRPDDELRLTLKRDTARDRLQFRIMLGDVVAGEGTVGGAG